MKIHAHSFPIMQFKLYMAFLCLLITTIISCKRKEENCQPVTLEGEVKHHSSKIPYARVFLKKGTKDSPGTDTNLYDISVQADANARFTVSNIQKDNYYIYGIGYDPAFSAQVFGGVPFTVNCEEAGKTYSLSIPVVE